MGDFGRTTRSRRIVPVRFVSIAWLPLVGLAACASNSPAFRIEVGGAVAPRPDTPWISVASPSTAPPGEQRFARLYADGTAESREVFTPNGPGPSLTLIGQVQVEPSVVKHALALAETPEATTSDRSAPCVLALHTSAVRWQGCAHFALAARLLAATPRLTMPAVSRYCTSPFCQVRIVREISPVRHEQYGDVRQDRLLDSTGAFWCATGIATSTAGTISLRVERGAIANADALRVFDWVIANVRAHQATSGSVRDPSLDRVMVRGRDGQWTPVVESIAVRVRERWNRIASGLPEGCRSTR
jgi:hypothetical protein